MDDHSRAGKIPPLRWSDAILRPTALQKVLWGIPGVGPNQREARRLREELAARPENCRLLWPGEADRQALREKLFDILEHEMEWGARTFIPSDPCEILFFDPSMDMKSATALMAVEDLAGGPIALEEILYLTLGELLERIAAQRQSNDSQKVRPDPKPENAKRRVLQCALGGSTVFSVFWLLSLNGYFYNSTYPILVSALFDVTVVWLPAMALVCIVCTTRRNFIYSIGILACAAVGVIALIRAST